MTVFVQKVRIVVQLAAVAAVALLMLGLAISTVRTPPGNAQVFANDLAKEFVTPPYLESHPELGGEFVHSWTYGQARASNYRAERGCNNEMCWSQEGRSLTGGLLQGVGLLPVARSRWNSDGSWNW